MTHDLVAALEALLFIHGEPITLKKITETLGVSEAELQPALNGLRESLAGTSRGLALISDGKRVQLATKASLAPLLSEFVKGELKEELSAASVEVLSIIAYLGPLTRAKIEYIRGVNSSFTLRSLLMRGLIDRSPNPAQAGTFAYRASFELLRHLGVENQTALPEYEKFQELLKNNSSSL